MLSVAVVLIRRGPGQRCAGGVGGGRKHGGPHNGRRTRLSLPGQDNVRRGWLVAMHGSGAGARDGRSCTAQYAPVHDKRDSCMPPTGSHGRLWMRGNGLQQTPLLRKESPAWWSGLHGHRGIAWEGTQEPGIPPGVVQREGGGRQVVTNCPSEVALCRTAGRLHTLMHCHVISLRVSTAAAVQGGRPHAWPRRVPQEAQRQGAPLDTCTWPPPLPRLRYGTQLTPNPATLRQREAAPATLRASSPPPGAGRSWGVVTMSCRQ